MTKDRTDFSNIFSTTTRNSNSSEYQNDISNAVQPEIERNKASTPGAINYTLDTMSTFPEACRKSDSCNISITEESNSSFCKFLNIYFMQCF